MFGYPDIVTGGLFMFANNISYLHIYICNKIFPHQLNGYRKLLFKCSGLHVKRDSSPPKSVGQSHEGSKQKHWVYIGHQESWQNAKFCLVAHTNALLQAGWTQSKFSMI